MSYPEMTGATRESILSATGFGSLHVSAAAFDPAFDEAQGRQSRLFNSTSRSVRPQEAHEWLTRDGARAIGLAGMEHHPDSALFQDRRWAERPAHNVLGAVVATDWPTK